MKIGYPEKNGSKEDLKFTNSYGKYLISHFNTWHGGIHLEGAKKAIQTIAKGRIIAYRLQEKYEVLKGTQKASKKKYTYSNSFILMQHDLELTKEVQTKEGTDKVEKKQVTFYSLYNHLMPLKEQEKLGLPFPDFISKEELKVIKKERYDSSFKKAGLNGRVLNAAGKVQRGASGVKVIIPYGTIVQKYKDTAGNFVTENSYTRVVYEDETGTIYDDIYIYTKKGKVKKEGERYRINTKEDFPTDKGARVREAPGKAITAIIPYNETVEIVKKEGNWYRIKGYEGVSHKGNFEKRKILNTKAFTKNAITASDIPVESGVCIGYTGAMHGENTPWYCASQLDVFMTEGVEDFLKNTFGATVTGKNFITLPEGTKLKEKLSVSVKLEKNLPVKIVEIRGNYAKINVPKFVDKIVDKRDLYTPNKSSADGKMRGYNRIRGYHILNFENINKRFDGLLIEGESKLFCHGLRNSKVQRKVKYYPKEGGKKGYWVPLDALSKNVVYEEKEEVREVPKRLNVFEGLLDYIVTQDRTVQKKVKVCKAVKVPIAKNQKVLLNRFIDTAYLEVSKKDEEEELYKEVVVDLRGAKECMVKKKKYLKVRCSYTIGNDSYKQEGWIPAKGLEKKAFNGYDWERFGFELVDGGKEYMYDIKDLREASTTESRFVETMWRKLGVVEDDVLDFFELEAAYALLETQEKISKMVCKHKIEWSYTPEEIAKEVEGFYNYYIGYQRDLGEDTQKLEELKEEKLAAIKEQVSKLMFWKEASALPYGAHKEVRALGADLKMQPLSLLTSSSTEGATCFNVFDSDEEIAKKEALKKQAPKKDSVKKKQVAPARRARSKQEKQPVRKFPNTDMVYHFHPIGFVNQMKLIFEEEGECYCNKDLTVDFVKNMVKTMTGSEKVWQGKTGHPCPITDKSYETLVDELNKMFKKYEINECIQKIAFLAQVSAETGMFRQSIEESGSEISSQSTFRGRGIIQLTGSKDNTGFYNSPGIYKNYADYIGDQSIISNPDKISQDIHYTVDSAGWYFSKYKKVPKWNPRTDAYASAYKKKRNYFSKALGKSLNETTLLINDHPKYFWLVSKMVNGYGRGQYLEVSPNGWDHRLKSFNKLNAVFKFNTICVNNPNKFNLNSRASWMQIAYGELWTEEIAGSKHNPRVLEYHASAGHTGSNISDDKKWAWCSSFACWVFTQSKEYTGKITAKATNWKNWGKADSRDKPIYGSLAVIDWGENDDGRGHVGFVVNVEGNDVYLLGGNQTGGDKTTNGKVCVSRYDKSVIDYFRIPENYTPENKDYEYDDIKNTNLSFETLSSTR
ncbi:CHAP domain-containing protein [Tenacibaculum maritimum]|uniref:CHAP domain-containing protein n=3 Tax=Tenacibaculum maritimum TaxID=107401 RepID=UPI003876E57B